MALTDPPPAVEALAAMLAASATFQTLTGTADATAAMARIHYPSYPAGIAPTAATLPCALLFPEEAEAAPLATGVSLPRGVVSITIAAAEGTALEKPAAGILADLQTRLTGLPIVGPRASAASEPMPCSRAGGADDADSLFHTIRLTIPHGLRA